MQVGSKSKITRKTKQQDLHSLLIYRLLLALHKHQRVQLSVYGFIFVVCTWQLFLSVAIAKTKPELFVRILVYSALPIVMWFIIRSVTLTRLCTDKLNCEQHHIHSVVVDLDEDVYLLDKISVCQLWVMALTSITVFAHYFLMNLKMDEVGVLKVINSPGNVYWLLEWLSLSILLGESQLLLHLLHMEATYTTKNFCLTFWCRRWGSLGMSVTVVLCVLLLSNILRLLATLHLVVDSWWTPNSEVIVNNSYTWLYALVAFLATYTANRFLIPGQVLLLSAVWAIMTMGWVGYLKPASDLAVTAWCVLASCYDTNSKIIVVKKVVCVVPCLLQVTIGIHLVTEVINYMAIFTGSSKT